MGKVISNSVANKETKIYCCESTNEVVKMMQELIESGDIILVKASNGMKFNTIIEGMKRNG